MHILFFVYFFYIFYLLILSSLSDLSTWEMSHLRKALPNLSDGISSPDGVSSNNNKTPRKTHYRHKANTIGLPPDSELHDNKNNHIRPKRNIFEGFRNTLRNKHKSDTVVLEAAAKDLEKGDIMKRWSDNNHSVSIPLFLLSYRVIL